MITYAETFTPPKTFEEFRPDGSVFYRETWKPLTKEEFDTGDFAQTSMVSRHSELGCISVRVGDQTKFNADGSINWQIRRTDKGQIISTQIIDKRIN